MGAGKMQICNEISAKAGNRPKITGRNKEITGKSRMGTGGVHQQSSKIE
jgi:hypothetical protein